MKIGLLTTYSFNYGSYHQAVALQKQLMDLGYDCELINERIKTKSWKNLRVMYGCEKVLPKILLEMVGIVLPQFKTYLRLKKDVALWKESPDDMLDLKILSKRYDCIVVGSDELWSADNSSIRFSEEYFGVGWECPIISYGTCAVKLGTDNPNRKQIEEGLKGFSAISVRDDDSKRYIESYVRNMEVKKVIDPTLLNPFFIDELLPNAQEKYCLLYGQHYDDVQKSFIIKYAKEYDLKIYSVGWPIGWADSFIDVSSAKQLQDSFGGAEFCFPSTFHGTIFSILNHRQFISMINPLRGRKIELLLKDLNLESRIFNSSTKVEEIEKIDYLVVENYLEKKRAD